MKKDLKFKVGDTIRLKQLPCLNLKTKLEEIGIYYSEKIIYCNGEIIETDCNDDLPYHVLFSNGEECFLDEDLIELVPEEDKINEEETETIKIKYHEPITPLENINGANSDWIDLRCAEPNGVDLKAGEFKLISLGVSMKLPDGYEAHVVPRSSTFKKWGIIQTNHEGIIDNLFCGDDDKWMFPAYATRDTHIDFNDRICQFRIMKKQPIIKFEEVEKLTDKNRGGLGSSGVK